MISERSREERDDNENEEKSPHLAETVLRRTEFEFVEFHATRMGCEYGKPTRKDVSA